MKYIITSLFLYLSFFLNGQIQDSTFSRKKIANNTIYAEIGGVCGWGGLHYERLVFISKNLKWKFFGDIGYSQYNISNSFTRSKNFQIGLLYGNLKNNIYYDLSVVYFNYYNSYQGTRSFIEYNDWFILPKFGIRYQKPKNGLFLNATLFYLPNTDPISVFSYDLGIRNNSQLDRPYIPSFWFGIGIGYTFKCL